MRDESLEQKKEQAINEGGLILTLSKENAAGSAVSGLLSNSKDTDISENTNIAEEKSAPATMSREDLAEQVIAYLREAGTDESDINAIGGSSNEELAQFIKLWENWIPVNEKYGDTLEKYEKDLSFSHTAYIISLNRWEQEKGENKRKGPADWSGFFLEILAIKKNCLYLQWFIAGRCPALGPR